jgi:colanic acid/amylovoran biosynthesis glycosyltransferase
MIGLNYSLEALVIVKNKGINFNYTIVGSGAAFEELAFTVNQLELTNEVNLVGVKSHYEIIDYLSNTDIYLQYSNSEGFCNAVLEAQAMGILCIVSDGGALSENIIDNETGWLVEKRNPEVLAKKIIEVLNLSKADKNKISNQAQLRSRKHFNLEQQNQQFVKFYA